MKKKITPADVDIFEELLYMYSKGESIKTQNECFDLFSSKYLFSKVVVHYINRLESLPKKEALDKIAILISFSSLHVDNLSFVVNELLKKIKKQ